MLNSKTLLWRAVWLTPTLVGGSLGCVITAQAETSPALSSARSLQQGFVLERSQRNLPSTPAVIPAQEFRLPSRPLVSQIGAPATPQPGGTPATPKSDSTPPPASTPTSPASEGVPTTPTPAPPAAETPQPQPSPSPTPAQPAPTTGDRPAEPKVLIGEIKIEGLEGNAEAQKLTDAAYAAIKSEPGTSVSRSDLEADLNAIYATGYFSTARVTPSDTPLGVRLTFTLEANPPLQKVQLDGSQVLPESVVQESFKEQYGRVLNLNDLQASIKKIEKWYKDNGYVLAQVAGASRISPDGTVTLRVTEGKIADITVRFLDKEGNPTNDKGQPVKGRTRPYIILREMSLKPGDVFRKEEAEASLQRVFNLGLFSDVKLSLDPAPADPADVVMVVNVAETSVGSVSAGIGYAGNTGVFGSVNLQDKNFAGRNQQLGIQATIGTQTTLGEINFSDPWIRNDPYRTSFNSSLYVARDVNPVYYNYNTDISIGVPVLGEPGNTQNLIYRRYGGFIQWVRPLSKNVFKPAPWTLTFAITAAQVEPTGASDGRTYARSSPQPGNPDGICLTYTCTSSDFLVGVRLGLINNRLNDNQTPTKGHSFNISTEQYLPFGKNGRTINWNRVRASYSRYFPVKWLKFTKGCRQKDPSAKDCPQTLAFNIQGGTNFGTLPPYEAFCLGGINSVRGSAECALGSGRSYLISTLEYRFPVIALFSGTLFVDYGTTLGSQSGVLGKPGELLDKPGSGFGVGAGVIVNTPVGPLRLEYAYGSRNGPEGTGGGRFGFSIGYKF